MAPSGELSWSELTASMNPSFINALRNYTTPIWGHRQNRLLVSAAVIGFPILSYIVISYNGYIAIGPGGLPHNFLGWMMQAASQPFGLRSTTSLLPYHDKKTIDDYGEHGREAFFGQEPLPHRQGARPEVPSYVVPQRQTSDKCTPETVARLNENLIKICNHNPDLLSIQNSNLEHRDSKALWINVDNVPLPEYLSKSTKGELCHVHNEGSSHAVLSLTDAEAVIRMGWGQRHKLSGVILPITYVMIYAPRDDEEVEVWKRIVGAAVGFAAANLKMDVKLEF